MQQSIPIVFIHTGDSWWLPYVLYQAKSFNSDIEIILISDLKKSFEGIKCLDIESFKSDLSRVFESVFEQMSFCDYDYDIFCWLRWFYLLEYMKGNNIKNVLYLDSDVLIFSSVNEIIEKFREGVEEVSFFIPEKNIINEVPSAAAHTSFWNIENLEKFCHFSISSYDRKNEFYSLYKEKWKNHQENQLPGGIIDMTTLYYFWKENSDDIINLAMKNNNFVCDHNINTSDNYYENEYVTEKNMKKVIFRNNVPFFIDNNKNQIQVLTMHLQGLGKAYMSKYYRGERFNRSICRIIKSKFYSNYYKTLKIKNSLKA